MKRSVVLGLVSVGVVVAAGCGSPTPPLAFEPPPPSPSAAPAPQLLGEEKKSPADVYADMRKAFLSAPSVHVSGAQLDGEELVTMDGQLTPTGGRYTEHTKAGVVSIVTKDDTTYVKAPADYFGDDEKFPDQLSNKWVAVPGPDAKARITSATFFDQLMLPPVTSLLSTVSQDQKSGVPVVVLTYDNGETLVIANQGSPVLLSHTFDDESETQTFDGYGAPVSITAPENSVQLGGGGKTA